MPQDLWSAVDEYLSDIFLRGDPGLDRALAASAKAGLPAINVSPPQGKFLNLLARLKGTRRILEIGTLGGYSTIWLARALPGEGKLITLELNPKHAEIANANFVSAGVAGRIELRLGPALETLQKLKDENADPFDLIFIDADKENSPLYFTNCLALTRPCSVIIVDNVIRHGAVIDAKSQDPAVLGVRRLNDLIKAEPRVSATALQTVGSKGYDGLTIALVLG